MAVGFDEKIIIINNHGDYILDLACFKDINYIKSVNYDKKSKNLILNFKNE